MDTFLGEPVKYWVELQKQAESLNVIRLIRQNAELRAKVSFYESQLEEMNEFRKVVSDTPTQG